MRRLVSPARLIIGVVLAKAPVRFAGHLGLGDQPASGRIPSGEVDAGRFADGAPAAVAADEILRPEPAVRQLDIDAGVVLGKPGHVAFAIDRHREFADPFAENALDMALEQPEREIAPGRKVGDIERNQMRVEQHRGMPRPLRDESIADAALIEHLHGARMQSARPRADQVRSRAPLDDGDIDPGQRQDRKSVV